MYVREEKIEEENLDWGELTQASKDNQDKLIEDAKEEVVHDPISKPKKIFLKKRDNSEVTGPKFDLKDEVSHLFKQHGEISLLLGIIFIPYILGFIISYLLFYFYGGMPISNFLSVQKVPTTIELWSMGAYLLVVVGAVLAFFVP